MHDIVCASCGSQNIRLITETYHWSGDLWVKVTQDQLSQCYDCQCVGVYMYKKEYKKACEQLETASIEKEAA